MQPGSPHVQSRRRFDVDEYHRMIEAGVLTENDRCELIDGEIVEMSPIGVRHAAAVRLLNRAMSRLTGDPGRVSVQNPVPLPRWSEPEPDIVVLCEREDDYLTDHPRAEDVALIVEVADASLRFDRNVKVPLYARYAIREVWIVDLTSDAVEVYREPVEEGYRRCERYTSGTVTAVAFPDVEIRIDEIVPPEG